MEAEMWDESFQADLHPGVFLGLDFRGKLPGTGFKHSREEASESPEGIYLGGGLEILPLRRSREGTGDSFHFVNFNGLFQYNFSNFFARMRGGMGVIVLPSSQSEQELQARAGPSFTFGAGLNVEDLDLEVFYGYHASYLKDELLEVTERIDINRIGISLGFDIY